MKKVLIIEDDAAIRIALEDYLSSENYSVESIDNGAFGVEKIIRFKPDLIILDLMLPGMNGIDICKEVRIRNIKTPIIMLTSKSDEADKVIGLELGADDYITKPFSLRELSARIKAVLRRATEVSTSPTLISFGDITINPDKMEVLKKKKEVPISATEFKLLMFFINHEGEVISREKVLDEVWGYESFPSTRTVDNFILSLRKLIEKDPSTPKHIVTVHKIGYKFKKD
ncbi:MAG TPA: response regulator transcription factor [Ignavibacteriaceae bacterium]|nr:response regulator transcription factor [Ignavibacteriaceae bacterium]